MQNSTSYLNIIAGAMEVHSEGLVEDSIILAAREALGTEQVHCLIAEQPTNNRVLYFALPSAALASEANPVSQLAAALPGSPDYRGNGVYVLNATPYKIAATVYDDLLTVVIHDAPYVDAHAADTGLPVFQIDNAAPRRFESKYTTIRREADTMGSAVMKFSVGLAAVSVIALVGSAIFSGISGAQSKEQIDPAALIQTAAADLITSSPLTDKLLTLQARSSVTARAGGWIDFYEVKENQESLRSYMPAWVTKDYLDGMGSGVRADLTAVSPRLIQVVAGNPVPEDIVSAEQAVNGGAANMTLEAPIPPGMIR